MRGTESNGRRPSYESGWRNQHSPRIKNGSP